MGTVQRGVIIDSYGAPEMKTAQSLEMYEGIQRQLDPNP